MGQFGLGRWLAGVRRLSRLSVGQHSQRIDGVDLGSRSGLGMRPGNLEVEMRALLAGTRGKCCSIRLDEIGIYGPRTHVLVGQQRLQESNVGRGACHMHLAQRAVSLGEDVFEPL